MSFLDSAIWPAMLGLFAVTSLFMFAVTRRVSSMMQGIMSCAAMGIWINRREFLGVATAQATEPAHGLSWLVALGGYAVVFVLLLVVRGDAERSVPRVADVATHAKETGLDALASWLRANGLAVSMPNHARLAYENLIGHVAELQKLGLSATHELVTDISKMLDTDLRNLLVRYKRVEVARKLLPGSSNLGDAELVNGLVQIEQALVDKRKTLAEAALNDLKVEARYIETKHGDVLN